MPTSAVESWYQVIESKERDIKGHSRCSKHCATSDEKGQKRASTFGKAMSDVAPITSKFLHCRQIERPST